MHTLITEDLLRQAMPRAHADDIADFVQPLNVACAEYGIDSTAERLACFLAQISVESDDLWHARAHYDTVRGEEYASGEAYENRHDLGNVQPGTASDSGRGILQVTGRQNYHRASSIFGVDFEAAPEHLLEPKWSCLSAAYYWQSHGCNELSDAGTSSPSPRRSTVV